MAYDNNDWLTLRPWTEPWNHALEARLTQCVSELKQARAAANDGEWRRVNELCPRVEYKITCQSPGVLATKDTVPDQPTDGGDNGKSD